jgi:hypothetical protein
MMMTVNAEKIEWRDYSDESELIINSQSMNSYRKEDKTVGKIKKEDNGFKALICCGYYPTIEFINDFTPNKELGLYETIQEAKLQVEIYYAKLIDKFNRFRWLHFIWALVTLRGMDAFEAIKFVFDTACLIFIVYVLTHPEYFLKLYIALKYR